MIKEISFIAMIMGVTQEEVTCLAMNMYHEARNQGTAGLLAVSNVVLNRVQDERFPDTICGVVKQGPTRKSWREDGGMIPIKNRCQFSWYCDGKSDEPNDEVTYEQLYELSVDILSTDFPYLDITDGATHYHADYIFPAWAITKARTIEIEDHIFYRWEH